MPDPNDACTYECIFGVYALVGGTPPEGYTCPDKLGTCSVPGDITLGPAVPIDAPITDDPPGGIEDGVSFALAQSSTESNSASYTYDTRTGMLYFSSGNADKGNGFFSSMTLDQLASHYPSIAEDMSVLLAVRSLASFKLTLPALPISVVARRDD